MRNPKTLIPLALALLLGACGPVEFLNSCFSEKDQIFEPALIGTWADPDGSTTLRFRKTGDKDYELIVTEGQADNDEPEQTRYDAHLADIGGTLFLDLLPEAPEVKPGAYAFSRTSSDGEAGFQPRMVAVGDGLYASLGAGPQASEAGRGGGAYEVHLVQAHRVERVELDGDTLRLTDLSEDWLKATLDSGQAGLGHEVVDDTLVVTAATQEIQALLGEFAGDSGAFPQDNTTELRRQD